MINLLWFLTAFGGAGVIVLVIGLVILWKEMK